MAIDIKIAGAPYRNANNYSVTEDSTPIDPSDMTGGYGQFTFGIDEPANPLALRGKTVDLADGAKGTTTGTIRGMSGSDGAMTLTADSRMALLAVERTAQPFQGTLGGVFTYYLSLVGITSGFVVDPTIADTPVVFPGWHGVVWDYLKQMCAAQQVETSLVSNNIVLRPLRGRVARNFRDASVTWALDASSMARKVEIYRYLSEYKTNSLAYPPGGWGDTVQIQNVDAGKTITVDVPIDASLISVSQPVCMDFVDRDDNTASVYTVVGNDGLPILPAQWSDGGGKVTVAIGEDTRSLIFTITGMKDSQYAPYSLAMASGESDRYSSLRIIGSGVFMAKELRSYSTGVDPDLVSQEVGATIDNPFMSTDQRTYDSVVWALKRWGAPSHSINVNTTGINRVGDAGSYRYPTFGEFDAANADVGSFGEFDAAQNPDDLFSDFDARWKATVDALFANQAFGNIAGARVLRDGHMFRIRNATAEPGGVSYRAEEDTLYGDLDALWPDATFGSFDAANSDLTSFGEFDLKPLRKVNA